MRNDWAKIKLKAIATSIQYGYTESSSSKPIGPKFLRITDIQEHDVNWDEVPYCKISDDKLLKYLLEKGDLLFARTGATVGKSFLINKKIPESVFASYLIRVRVNHEVLTDLFLSLFFQSPFYWKQITEGQVGIGQPNVNGTKLGKLGIPLAPLPEQRAIVEKIEALFSDLDQGIADLKTAQAQLKIYRQAVLKKAFEGAYSQKITETKKVEINGLTASIPRNWSMCRLGDIAKLQGGFAFKSAEYKDTGIPIVKIKNVHYQDIDWSDKTFIEDSRMEEFRAYALKAGDVLIAMTRPIIKSLNNVKTVVVKESDLPALLNQRVGRFLINDCLNKDYLKYFVFTDFFKRRVIKESSSSQQPNISSTKIDKFDFVMPCSLAEQHQIVREIETRLSVCDEVEDTLFQSLGKAEALRQSILKKAFEGRLLSEAELAACRAEPDYEPAAALLARIQAEK